MDYEVMWIELKRKVSEEIRLIEEQLKKKLSREKKVYLEHSLRTWTDVQNHLLLREEYWKGK